MKRNIITILLSLLTLTVSAQSSAEARRVLDRAASVISKKSGASASFSMSNAKMGQVSGTIAIKGKKFRAATPQAIVWFDGTTQWSYMKKTEEVTVSTPNAARQASMNPYAFINLYKSGYNLSMTTKGKNYEVRIVAQDKKKEISEIYVYVNKTTSVISSVRLCRKSQWTTISISNFKSANLSDAQFKFNSKDFPGAEIIDLR